MSTSIDVMQLVADMKDAATQILSKDITTLRGFSDRQIEAIAKHTQLVAHGIANGEITDRTRDFFLDSIEDMVLSFVKTLHGLLLVTIEKVWNAIVDVIWKAIDTAAGLSLTGSIPLSQ